MSEYDAQRKLHILARLEVLAAMSMHSLDITMVDTRLQLLPERTQCRWLMPCLIVGTSTRIVLII